MEELKGFIEITYPYSYYKKIIRLDLIEEINEPEESSFKHTYVRINYNNEVIEIKESYEEIKQLIKNAQ